jgi:hypothetical protein
MTVKLRVEALVSSAAARVPLDPDTAAWVGTIGDDLADRLAAVGLIPGRPRVTTMEGLLDHYLNEKEADNKTGTKTNHRTVSNDLSGFFGPSKDPRAVTPDDAKRFLDHLKRHGLAAATIARRIRRVRSISRSR